MADIIQLRRDTSSNWTTANPVLADGEVGYETDTKKGKIGNGTTAWNALPYSWVDASMIIGSIEQNSRSANYTLVLTDQGKHIFHPSADTKARTWTIPANSSVAFPVGTAITFVNQNRAGVITIAINKDTMRLAGAGPTGSRTLAANGIATALKITSTEWLISGTNLT